MKKNVKIGIVVLVILFSLILLISKRIAGKESFISVIHAIFTKFEVKKIGILHEISDRQSD